MIKKSIQIVLLSLILTLSSFTFEDWYKYESTNFNISFPQKPVEGSIMMNTQAGEVDVKTLLYKAQNSSDKNLRFYVSCSGIPNASREGFSQDAENLFLDAAVKGSVRNHKAILLSEKPIRLGKFSGREARMSMSDNKIVARLKSYIVGDEYYGLIVYTLKENDDNSEIEKFFNSFVVKTK